MIDNLFLQILNMSFAGGVVILFVLLARLFLKKAPKIFSYTLWCVALFRLICPFSFESILSFIPINPKPISNTILYDEIPQVSTGITGIDHFVNSSLPPGTYYASVNPLQIWVFIGEVVWLTGIAVLFIYSLASLIRLHKQLKNAVCERDNIYIAANLDTPFVLGIIKPKIYLPEALLSSEKEYILLHEQTHIKRFDHVIKIVSFLVLCIHWFNPLVWIAFFISGRDMEMSCDESVIKKLGDKVKKEYSSSLLTLAIGKRILAATPLAFGEGNTKSRIKNVINYKKPAFWVIIITLIAISILSFGLLSNPIQESLTIENYPEGQSADSTTIEGIENASVDGFPQTPISKYIGYISNFSESHPNSFYFDPVEWITLEDTKRIGELDISSYDMPNGYYIHNPNADNLFLQVNEKTEYNFIDWGNNFVAENEDRNYSTTNIEEFIQYLNTYSDKAAILPFWVETKDGYVKSITEQFVN